MSLDPARVKALFASAIALDPDARAAFLREACGSDAELHGEVSSLLEFHDDRELIAEPDAAPAAGGGSIAVGSIAVGSLVGEYRIEALLGAGGMGEVYGAIHPVINKRVAIKVMNEHCSASPASVTRFVDEAKVVNAIDHPNIVDIFSYGTTEDGRCYFVMEWMVGESLRARMDRGRLGLARVLDILDAVLCALEAAHAAHIVHRDLKPANIFLTAARPPDPERVKLLDFGIAKLVEDTPGAALWSHKTETGTVIGTPSYMAPEQAAGKPVAGPADIYALGVVAFELITGQLPFEADSGVQMTVRHIEEPPRRPSSIVPVPAGVEQVVLDMLAKTVGERPTATEVRARIQRLRDEPGAGIEVDADAPARSPRVPAIAAGGAPTRPAPPQPRRARPRAAILVGVLATAVTSLAVILALARGTATTLSADARPAAKAGAAEPWFERSPPGADGSYAVALRAIRDGFVVEAFDQLSKAERVTPWLAPAFLRRSVLDRLSFRRELSRVDFARAVEYRDRLDALDKEVLDAYRHIFLETPPDPGAWEDALARLSDRHPTEPELAYYAGLAHSNRGAPEAAMASFDRASASDPQFASALAALAFTALDSDDLARARGALDRCLVLERRSPACSKAQILALSRTGDAARVLTESEAWLRADPEHADEANAYRAEALLALGRPFATIEEVVHARTRRLADDRSRTKLFWERQLALLEGDFPRAERALRDQIAFMVARSDEWEDHAVAVIGEVELAMELGRAPEAAAAAARARYPAGGTLLRETYTHVIRELRDAGGPTGRRIGGWAYEYAFTVP